MDTMTVAQLRQKRCFEIAACVKVLRESQDAIGARIKELTEEWDRHLTLTDADKRELQR